MANITNYNAKDLANSDTIVKKFQEVLGDNYKFFMHSVINSVNNNPKLLECDGASVWYAAMNAAVLGLPIDNNLSYSAIIPYGRKAQFQIMTKGYIQLAIDTGLYKKIHVIEIYEDELEFHNPILDETFFTDKSFWKQRNENRKDKVVGYFAYIELINGFYKEKFMFTQEVINHAKLYSKTFNFKGSLWLENPIAMGKKTCLKALLRGYGKLGKASNLEYALKVDQGFSEGFDEDPKYYDNPKSGDNLKPSENISVEVEDDYIEAEFKESDPLNAAK